MGEVHLNIELYDSDFIGNGLGRPVKNVYVKLIMLCFAKTVSESFLFNFNAIFEAALCWRIRLF